LSYFGKFLQEGTPPECTHPFSRLFFISAITALSSVNDAPGIASFLRLVLTKIMCTVISATLY
jgi:hypothetical protein